MYDAFTICFSPDGSNNRVAEEATVMLWVHFLQTIERKYHYYTLANQLHYIPLIGAQGDVDVKGEKFQVSLSDVMIFTTEPPLGFSHKPCIKFCDGFEPIHNSLFLPNF